MKSRKLLLSLAVFFLVGAFASAKATPVSIAEGEEITDPIVGWHQIGPDNVAGRVRTIMFDKFNDGVIYACSPTGGLFVSVNDGNNWQEIALGEGENRSYVATSIAQDDNGVIYVGTGEGFYSESFAGKKSEKTGMLGNGVYKSSTFDKNWATNIEGDEAKYQFVAENISFTQMQETAPVKYDLMDEWAYVNDMAFTGGKLFIATKYGLKVYDGSTITTKAIHGNASINITDIKVSGNGKIAVAYILNDDAVVAIADNADADFVNSLTKEATGLNAEDLIIQIEVAFGINDPEKLYALVYYGENNDGYLYPNEAIFRKIENGWEKASPASFSIGVGDGMSIAINDRTEEEFIYAAGMNLVSGFNANNDPIFYYNALTSYIDTRNSGSFVAPGIHAIAFDPNPETAEDSLKIYLATDAGIYIYKQDPMTHFEMWHASNKGLVSSQYYNVTSTNDGAVFGAAQSNAISYIPTPSTDLKSAETIWSPNSLGYYEISSEISQFSYLTKSQSGVNVVASAIHQTVPTAKKPVVLARPYLAVTRTYSDNNDFESINDQTWNYGSETNLSFMNGQITVESNQAPFITPMAYWESFNAPAETRDSVYLKLDDKLTVRRNGTNYMYSHGFELKDGDSVIVQSDKLGYPFFYIFTAEEYGTHVSEYTEEEVLNIATTQDSSILVPNPIQTRLFIAGANGLYLCNEVMNFTKTFSKNNLDALPWIKLINFTTAQIGKRRVTALAPSENGNSLLLSIDIDATSNAPATTELYRLTGMHQYDLGDLNTFSATFQDVEKFTTEKIASFDRTISSITYAADSNVAIITLDGFNSLNDNIYRLDNVNAANVEDITLTPIALGDNMAKPVYTALIETVNTDGLTAYVGTDDGVYKTTDYTASTVTWTKEENFPSIPVYDLFQQKANLPSVQFTTYIATNASNNVYGETKYPGAIYAATYGKGLYMNYDNITENRPEPVSLNSVEQLATTNINLYPNPAQNRTTLSYSLQSSSSVVLNIFDMNGRLISSLNKGSQRAGVHTQEISLNSLEKGVYMIQIITNQTSEAVKLIVQ